MSSIDDDDFFASEFPDDEEYVEDDDLADEEDRSDFADPGGNSALRAATPENPRNLPPARTAARPTG